MKKERERNKKKGRKKEIENIEEEKQREDRQGDTQKKIVYEVRSVSPFVTVPEKRSAHAALYALSFPLSVSDKQRRI